jgi:DNA-binding beta-propeller fold protein YncE
VHDAPRFAWSDDTGRLLTWSTGDSIDMWDARTGRSIARIGSHDDPVSGAAMAGPGEILMTIAGRGLYLWNRPQVDRVLSAGQTPMTVSFSADGDKVITASGQSVQLYDAHSGSPISSIAAPAPITALALAPDDKHIAIGTAQGEILLHTLQDAPGSPVKLSSGGPITAVAFGASERQLAWAAKSPQQMTAVVLRNLATNQDVVSQQIPGVVVAMAVDDTRVAVGLDKPLRRYLTAEPNNGAADLRTVVQLVASTGSPVAVANSISAQSPQPKPLLPPGGPHAETESRPPLPSRTAMPPPSQLPQSAAASTPGEPQSVLTSLCGNGSASLSRHLGFGAAVTSCERTVSQWRNLRPALPLMVERPVARVAVSPDGNYLAVAYVDGGITLHHTSLSSRSATIAGPGDEITALTFDTPAARLAAARTNGSVTIYPISGPELRKAAEQLAGTLQPSAGECQRLFGASDQCEEIGSWRLVTHRIIQALTGR